MKLLATQQWLRIILISLVLISAFVVLPVGIPFIVSFVLAMLLLPIVNSIVDWAKKSRGWEWFPRWVAIIPAFLVLGLFSFIMVKYLVLPVLSELTRLVNNIPYLVERTMDLLRSTQGVDNQPLVPHQLDGVVDTALTKVGNYSIDIVQKGISAVLGFATTLLQLLIVPIVTFYLLLDGRQIKRSVVSVFEEPVRGHLMNAVNEIYRMIARYLRGQLILAVNMFCVILIVAYTYDLPYPLVLALLAAVAEWMPIVGPFISAIPAIALASLASGPLAVKVAITYLIIQLIDGQIIMPKVLGHVIKLHPLVIITVIFLGGYFYGMVGMMTAVPITATLQIIAQRLWYFNTFYKRSL